MVHVLKLLTVAPVLSQGECVCLRGAKVMALGPSV